MTQAATWAEHVSLHPRYQRSVHLERDSVGSAPWLDGYVVTPLVHSLTSRVVSGLAGEGTRAFSITGPYGTGKSAFSLYLSWLLSPSGSPQAKQARKVLKAQHPELRDEIYGRGGILAGKSKGLVPVLATGERRSLEAVLLRGLADAAREYWSGPGGVPSTLAELEDAAERASAGESIPARDVVSLFEEVAEKVSSSSRPGHGLLVMLDEAGKPLEFAASEPSRGDIQLLQELAEAASRSGDTPIVFVVVLHQAFERYAGQLTAAQRNEWSKVQGRFEDLAFKESNDQLLRLLATAVQCSGRPSAVSDKWLKTVVRRAAELVGDEYRDSDLTELLNGGLPLHPVTALSLGPLFRSRLAQNERSLFAFLSSTEPRGFQEFLQRPLEKKQPSLYSLDALYDYVRGALGGRLFGANGRVWARIEAALRRLPADGDALDARVVKTIGLLGAIADEGRGLRPSKAAIRAALLETGVVSGRALEASLKRLRSASVLVYRKYLDSYQLWEGSDLDLDALVDAARRDVQVDGALLSRMARVAPPQPMVARRHLLKTGNFRFFEVRYVNDSIVDELDKLSFGEADGVVLLTIPRDDKAADTLRQLTVDMRWFATLGSRARPVMIVVPHNGARLRELSAELAALEHVQTHTPELRDDPVARNELANRIGEAQRALRQELAGLSNGRVPATWCANGAVVTVSSPRALSRALSELCDATYKKAPHIHNELLNRRQLSSAAAAARRELMTGMVERAGVDCFGIEGSPPEKSMYLSVFKQHELHRRLEGTWSFGIPSRRKGGVRPVWDEIARMLSDHDGKQLAVTYIYDRLREPPYGVSDGVAPVLLLAVMVHGRSEIALYEEARFVPDLTAPVVERLLRAPQRFTLQRFALVGARQEVLDELNQTFKLDNSDGSVLPIVRTLVNFTSKLPAYTRNTKRVSKTAQRVRETLLRAKEPAPLVFQQLPRACGFEPFAPGADSSPEQAAAFAKGLRDALRELQFAYSNLLETIGELLRSAFGLPAKMTELRSEFVSRAERVRDAAVETRLKGFTIRVCDDALAQEEWLVSIGTLLAGRPPETWHDDDVDRARFSLGVIARQFLTSEALLMSASEASLPDGTQLLRVAIAEMGQREEERIVPVRPDEERLLRSFRARLHEVIDASSADLDREQMLTALALVLRDVVRELNKRSGIQPGDDA